MISKLPTSAREAKDTGAKALPSGQEPELTRSIETTEAAEAAAQLPEASEPCAREEKPAPKES